MSIPAILGACVLDLKDLFAPGNAIGKTQLTYYGIGAVVAGVVGYVCIKTLLVLFNYKKMKYFSYYCFLTGIVAIAASFIILSYMRKKESIIIYYIEFCGIAQVSNLHNLE